MSEPMSDEQLKKIEDGVDWAESLKQSTWLAKSVRDCLGYIYQLDRENRKARELVNRVRLRLRRAKAVYLKDEKNVDSIVTIIESAELEIRAFLDGEESK